MKLQACLNIPERYKKCRDFVLRGSRVIAWGESCDFAAKLIGSPLSCGCKSIDATQLNSDGTADFNKDSDLGLLFSTLLTLNSVAKPMEHINYFSMLYI